MYIPSLKCVDSVILSLKRLGLRHVVLLCALVLGVSFQAFGQEATVVGTVTDPSGSVIANVKITITNVETGLVRTTTSNESGQYVVPDLHIGHYNVKAESSGFKAAEQKGIVLQVGDRTRLDFLMQLGGASETVTVEANAVRVQTDSGEVSNVITGQQLSQLAVNGRGIYQLAALTPGASSQINPSSANTPVGGDASVSFNVVGCNAGGPVALGKLYNPSRKKTFCFYSMEWRRYINGGLTNQTVPDPATYGGDFSSSSPPILVPSSVANSVLFGNCP